MAEEIAQFSAEYKGKTYYFHTKEERDRFKADPEKYLKEVGDTGEAA